MKNRGNKHKTNNKVVDQNPNINSYIKYKSQTLLEWI